MHTEFTAITMVRGEEDVVYAACLHHLRLGFDRLVVLSHVEHTFLRECVARLRAQFPDREIGFIEIEDEQGFSKRKADYIQGALEIYLKRDCHNVVYGFDADEFLTFNHGRGVKAFFDAFCQRFSGEENLKRFYFRVPWINVICKTPIPPQPDLHGRLLDAEYWSLGEQASDTKALCLYRQSHRLHMGYHWLMAKSDQSVLEPDAEATAFAREWEACVYHLPLRNVEQFFARIGNYVASAAKQEKHNRLSRFFLDNPHVNRQHFFEMCVAPEPSFKDYDELKRHLGAGIDEMVLMAFTKLMVKPRLDIGRALLTPPA
ncbi:glycosyltransferase family 2 protein [Salinicola sp. RZ23]|uniref:glycosyltransferase family 2 protein n=1 Tax=Salinicola sp. RZ23 TaxID=1949087 RepID=UPI000DA1C21E|nr:glycosyltransferase family 2 protein [Salinicola sp. RZ23]